MLGTTANALLDEFKDTENSCSFPNQMFSTEHMYPKLKAFAQAKGVSETYQALPYMRKCHVGRTRKPMRGLECGIPYITHPLTMACQAHAMGIREDTALAVILLHDVCYDCGILPKKLPFSASVQRADA